MLTRRELLAQAVAVTACTPFLSFSPLFTQKKKGFSIGACDWSIGKRSDIEAFQVAKKIGLDGLMVDMGSLENNLHLREAQLQKSYLAASLKTGVKISSLAIGLLNDIPYKSDPRTIQWVRDSIDVAKNLGVSVILMPFFAKNDLRNDEPGKKEVIRRLKEVAPEAEKKGIILGVESYLNAAEHLDIINAVGSKSVKIYMDFRNTADAGFDVLKEARLMGKENICELHMKENGDLLSRSTLPWEKIRDWIYEIDYYGDGWMQIEGAIPKNGDVVKSYQSNLQFLRSLFNKTSS
ncbi:MAG TPA: sugar phosphate isomerase/epimerase family protein [Chitinophagaceae bacterium]|jgi:sugar phosphate isomerase/epimerase|nr:sugar phosphate isomerase/epimerase family protein [Chitinophagaceae bacterium]